MQLIVVSGRSGSGKSTALTVLEDAGFDCIDNFPVNLLQSLVDNALRDPRQKDSAIAVCIDARSRDLERFPEILLSLDRMDVECQVVFLDALSPTLVKRFSETRRRHPLTDQHTDLRQAIEAEAGVLEPLSDLADLTIDTTRLSAQELGEMIRLRVLGRTQNRISLLFRSFGFKHGVPVDADFVFDVRCLPNPHWIPELRPLTGRDQPVIDYLSAEAEVNRMFTDISGFLNRWLPSFADNNRTYMTVCIGCTGGQHRSVYLAERLGVLFSTREVDVLVRHRELA
ncbi:MAG: RNase adapter RapZ [Gammaproteobacteria bacterium]|nr:RNase adapter RapZ [Gammaproteobacteria bacterium]